MAITWDGVPAGTAEAYQRVKAADTALSPVVTDPAAAAEVLNAQTIQLPPQDVSTADARAILLLSTTGDWFRINQLAKQDPTGQPIEVQQAISAAFTAIEAFNATTTLRVSDDATWSVVQAMLNGLVSAGAVSSASAGALNLLRSPSVPRWTPLLTEHDVTAARNLS